MFCNYCGNPNPDVAKFCRKCGKPVVHATQPAAPATPAPIAPSLAQPLISPPPVAPPPAEILPPPVAVATTPSVASPFAAAIPTPVAAATPPPLALPTPSPVSPTPAIASPPIARPHSRTRIVAITTSVVALLIGILIFMLVRSGRPRALDMQIGFIDSIAFSPDGRQLAVTGSDGTGAQLWDTASGQWLRTFNSYGNTDWVSFSPDGHTVATWGGSSGHIVILWDAPSGNQIRVLKDDAVSSAGPRSARMAACSQPTPPVTTVACGCGMQLQAPSCAAFPAMWRRCSVPTVSCWPPGTKAIPSA